MDLERPRRANGLSAPYTSGQLSTWFFLPTLVVEFLFFASPLLPLGASIPCTILFIGLAVSSIYFAYIAMKLDPADPRLDRDDCNADQRPECSWDPNEPTKQCWICDKQVGEKSMHCKFCNKCVEHFDHHCMWLNTCVGKANYPYFFRTMVSITAMLTVHATVQLGLIIGIFAGKGASRSRSEEWFNADATIAVVAVMCIFLLLDLAALSLIAQLLSFHVKLQREGLTTYSYIVRDNQRRREQTKKDNELSAQRELEIMKAGEEGQTIYSMHLRLGGLVRQVCGLNGCDPLKDQEPTTENSNETHGSTSNPQQVELKDPE